MLLRNCLLKLMGEGCSDGKLWTGSMHRVALVLINYVKMWSLVIARVVVWSFLINRKSHERYQLIGKMGGSLFTVTIDRHIMIVITAKHSTLRANIYLLVSNM